VLWDESLPTFPSRKDIVLEARILELVVWGPKSLWIRYSKKATYKRKHELTKVYDYASVDIYETTWYKIIGVSKSTYVLYKFESKWGCQFLPHGNKGIHKLRMLTKQAELNV
jgi:hypothetical protein